MEFNTRKRPALPPLSCFSCSRCSCTQASCTVAELPLAKESKSHTLSDEFVGWTASSFSRYEIPPERNVLDKINIYRRSFGKLKNREGIGAQLLHASVKTQGFRNEMEDYIDEIIQTDLSEDKSIYTIGVYDGHGGKQVSEYACRDASLINLFLNAENIQTIFSQAKSKFSSLDEKIINDLGKKETDYCGTTATIVSIFPRKWKSGESDFTWKSFIDIISPFYSASTESQAKFIVTCANVGDSEAVIFSRHKTPRAITVAHNASLKSEKDRIVSNGGLVYCKRVNGDLAISRALGDFSYKHVTTENLKLKVTPEQSVVSSTPDISVANFYEGDLLVVASDGLWNGFENMNDIGTSLFSELDKGVSLDVALENICKIASKISRDNIVASAIYCY